MSRPAWPASDARLAAALLAVSFAIYSAWGVTTDTYDTRSNAQLPISLILHGELAFTPLEAPFLFVWEADTPQGRVEVDVQNWNQTFPGTNATVRSLYEQGVLEFKGPRYFVIATKRQRPDTHEPLYVGTFGPVAGLSAVPLAFAAYAYGADLRDPLAAYRAARWTAALLTAGSVALVFLIAVVFLTRWQALVLAALYGLASCVWTLSSQALWQQTPEMFFLALGALCIVRGDGRLTRGVAAGLAFSAAAACRPTAAIVALVASGYLLLTDRRSFLPYVAAGLPILLLLGAYNQYYLGSPFEFGQLKVGTLLAKWKTGSEDVWQTPLLVGAAGLLVSPSRGLLIYTPWLLAAFAGGYMTWKEPKYERLRFLTIAVVGLWLPAFGWFDWWGGWTYGYRPIVDSTPLLAMLCVPVMHQILDRTAWRLVFGAAAAWSLFVQLLGVTLYTPWAWNARALDSQGTVANIDRPEYRHRLWSFRDSQISFLVASLARASKP